jgi:hypothetical protein
LAIGTLGLEDRSLRCQYLVDGRYGGIDLRTRASALPAIRRSITLFHEVQYFPWWVYGLVGGALLVLAAVALLFPCLEATVAGDCLSLRCGSLSALQRRIPVRDVERAEVCSYRPLRDSGGWGRRYGRGGMQAFTVKGSAGVRLNMRDGRRHLIGSARSEESLWALTRAGVPNAR